MQEPAQKLLRTYLKDNQLTDFAKRLHDWLLADLLQNCEPGFEFPESRGKSLLRVTDALDTATLRVFHQLLGSEVSTANDGQMGAIRVALHDLLADCELAENEEIKAVAAASAALDTKLAPSEVPWLTLALAGFAWKNEYPLAQLDPSSPPDMYSPAGQVIQNAAHFIRQQVQRSATERDKISRRLGFEAEASSEVPTIDELHQQQPIPPLPPHFRPPIPVRYPEIASETLNIEADEAGESADTPRLSDPVTITNRDLSEEKPPQRMPPIKLTADQIQSHSFSRPRVVTPRSTPPPIGSFAKAVRQKFGRSHEPFVSTKLRIIVQEYQDGPGLYGLQIKVMCKGIRSYVAGVTNRDGKFLCELPVRARSGLTYEVEVTWPRDLGGEVETKSITLNAERTEFVLPFYRRIQS